MARPLRQDGRNRPLLVLAPAALLDLAGEVATVLSLSLSRYVLESVRAALVAGGRSAPPLPPESPKRGPIRRSGTTSLRIASVPPDLLAALAQRAGPGGIGSYVRAALRAQLLRDGAELPPGV